MDVSRWVNLVYVGIFLVTLIILENFFNWLVVTTDAINQMTVPGLGGVITVSTAVALAVSVALVYYLYRTPLVQTYLSEVIVELSKVTWPDWDETREGTLVVIGFAVVLSGFLWISDTLWLWVSDMILLGEF